MEVGWKWGFGLVCARSLVRWFLSSLSLLDGFAIEALARGGGFAL